jgi:hypothetical protein
MDSVSVRSDSVGETGTATQLLMDESFIILSSVPVFVFKHSNPTISRFVAHVFDSRICVFY